MIRPPTYNSDATAGQNGEPALDALFRSLAHSRHRYILESLKAYESPLALADAADEVAIKELEMPLPEIDAERVKQIYLNLYHCHIPQLVDAGLIEYNQKRDLVTLTERAELSLDRHLP